MKKIKKEKEINAILSLDGSRVYSMVVLMVSCSIASWSKSTSADGVVLYILQKDERRKIDNSDKHTLPIDGREK